MMNVGCFALYFVTVLISLHHDGHVARGYVSEYCLPGLECWPSSQEQAILYGSLDGTLLFPDNAEYDALAVMKNIRVTKFPALIVVAKSVKDVQKSLSFARKFNIRVVIQSSGHDFQGRSTAYGCLQLYLGNMTDIKVQLTSNRNKAGEITIESGAQWIDVYAEVNKYDRVVIGGSAHTVSMGGYTLGGGHSPMSRMFGLAVDNLLEVEMVTADGKIRVITENISTVIDEDGKSTTESDPELFWALKGGGGGTFGIATKFTFKLHNAPESVVNFICSYPIFVGLTNVGAEVLIKVAELVMRMPKEWGGYITLNGLPLATAIDQRSGSITFFLNHYGGWDTETRKFMDELYNFKTSSQRYCIYKNYSTFLDYEKTAVDALYTINYVSNTLVQASSFTEDFITYLISNLFAFPLQASQAIFVGTLIGGAVTDVGTDDTPLHPGFRTGYISLSASLSWESSNYYRDDALAAEGIKLGYGLNKHGSGMYRNEASGNITDWKTAFWGDHFDRLQKVKTRIDKDNIFRCFDCVYPEHELETTTTTINSATTTTTIERQATCQPQGNEEPSGAEKVLGQIYPLTVLIILYIVIV